MPGTVCPHCAAPLPDRASFCPRCGQAIPVATATPVDATVQINAPADAATSSGPIAGISHAWTRYDHALKSRWPRGRWVVHGITGLFLASLIASPFAGASPRDGRDDPDVGVAAAPTVVATQAATPTPTPSTSVVAGTLVILAPSDGATVESSTIEVAGTAPAGAVVTRDIPMASDQHVTATDGNWSMVVELSEGANEIVLRLGDDENTAQTLHVTYQPVTSPAPTTTSTAVAEATATPEPTEEPTPEPTFASFDDGTWEVGEEIAPGTYRIREPAGFCYWARLKGFDGTLSQIIANENVVGGYAIVTIGKNDVGFESNGCGTWTKDLSRVTESTSRIDIDGTYRVGVDLKPGRWKSSTAENCYWARLKGFGGTLGSIIANDIVVDGRAIVTIKSTDKGFHTTGCGTWERD